MSVAVVHPVVSALVAGGIAPQRNPVAWLQERRALALERANALSVPSTRDEEWRFTDLSSLARQRFQPASSSPALTLNDIAQHLLPEASARLVFVDGEYSPALSQTANTAAVLVCALAQGLQTHAAAIEPYLAQLAAFNKQGFTAFNTAWLRDGALVKIERNVAAKKPVHLLFVSTQREVVMHPRILVVTDSGAVCTVIEDYVTLASDVYFTNAVTEIAVASGARVNHVRVQREAPGAFHIATCAVSLAKDASYHSQSIVLGAQLSRYNLDVTQRGEGAEAVIDGLALIAGNQLADTHTSMDHTLPNGRCTQLHKTIAGGAAHAVFNGKVMVREGAQLTNSAQQNRNLLLSPKAHVDTKPQLEIFADDVKCAHGATVGQLDAEHLFYLRSRGIPEAQARNLLTFAFGAEIINRIPVKSLVERLERAIIDQTRADV